MSLQLKIQTEYIPELETLRITETTENWGGDNPIRADVIKASILVEYNENRVTSNIDVTAEVIAGTLENLSAPAGLDGVYKIFLFVDTTGFEPTPEKDHEYGVSSIEYVSKELEANISKFWVKYACTTNLEKKRGLYDICDWLETNLAGLNSLAVVNQFARYVELLDLIKRKIDLNKNYLK